jgi:hypothetical protein
MCQQILAKIPETKSLHTSSCPIMKLGCQQPLTSHSDKKTESQSSKHRPARIIFHRTSFSSGCVAACFLKKRKKCCLYFRTH